MNKDKKTEYKPFPAPPTPPTRAEIQSSRLWRYRFAALDKEAAGEKLTLLEQISISISPLSIFLGPIHHTMAGMHARGTIQVAVYGAVVYLLHDAGVSFFMSALAGGLVNGTFFVRDFYKWVAAGERAAGSN